MLNGYPDVKMAMRIIRSAFQVLVCSGRDQAEQRRLQSRS